MTTVALPKPNSTSKTQANDAPDYGVLIMGGGHVGLSFALLLAHFKIACTLIEKVRYPIMSPDEDDARTHYLDSRNTALSRRTVQIYQEIGLWEKLQSHACRIDRVQIFEKDSFGRATLNKHEEKVESFGQVMENAHLGHKLLQAVQASPYITLIDGVSVTDIHQDAKRVHIGLDDGRQLSASLLVACDGQHSKARSLLGIEADTHEYGQVGIVGVVMTDKPHQHTAIECFSQAGPLALLPLTDKDGDGRDEFQQGHRRSVVWICNQGEEGRYLEDEAHFLAVLQQTFGELAGNITQAGRRGAYPLAKVLAHQQVLGRCVIMGNAAHTLHPVAGQGFNLCMRDAYTLASLLAQLHASGADLGNYQLLKDYEERRLKDQRRVIGFCDLVVNGFTHPNALVKFSRNVGLVLFDKVPFVKPLVATFAMGLKS